MSYRVRRIITCVVLPALLVGAGNGCRRIKQRLSNNSNFVLHRVGRIDQALPTDQPPTKLRVETNAGEVRVQAGESDNLIVEAKVKVRDTIVADQPADDTIADHMRIETTDGVLRVVNTHLGTESADDFHVSFTITAPRALATSVELAAGNVFIQGMTSDIDVNVAAGNVDVKGDAVGSLDVEIGAGSFEGTIESLGGPATLNTATGRLVLAVRQPPTHDITASTATGNVDLDLPDGATGTFKATAEVGNVEAPGAGSLSSKRSGLGAVLEGSIGEGGPNYALSAAVGNVKIR